jgi:hypothetical protein
MENCFAELGVSLTREGVLLERCRTLAQALHTQSVTLELAQRQAEAEGLIVESLRHALGDAEGAREVACAREACALAAAEHERVALGAAAARVESLTRENETLRQMLAAAPRPPRRQLEDADTGGGGGAAGESPFERWKVNVGLVSYHEGAREGGASAAGALSEAQRRRLGAAPRGETGATVPAGAVARLRWAAAAVVEGGGGEAGAAAAACAAAAELLSALPAPTQLGSGPLTLPPHPFWSPQQYRGEGGGGSGSGGGGSGGGVECVGGGDGRTRATRPIVLAHVSPAASAAVAAGAAQLAGGAGGCGGEGGAAAPERLRALTLSHVANAGRHGDDEGSAAFASLLAEDRGKKDAMLARLRDREGRVTQLRQWAQGAAPTQAPPPAATSA